MACILQAPYGAIVAAITLPNPQFGDKEAREQLVTPKRTMNGMLYTYVKSTNNVTLDFNFIISRRIAEDLKNFLLLYHQEEFLANLEWRNENWRLRLINNPIELLIQQYDAINLAEVDVNLKFEGTKLNA
jgi:hypothetical protein